MVSNPLRENGFAKPRTHATDRRYVHPNHAPATCTRDGFDLSFQRTDPVEPMIRLRDRISSE